MNSLIDGRRARRAFGGTLALVAASLALLPASAQANGAVPPADPAAFQTNGDVLAIARGGGLTFIGGNFTELSARTGPGARFDPATGQRIAPVAEVTGNIVNASVPDGQGGYYIGGQFDEVGGVARNNIAHILADGTVDPAFNPNADNPSGDANVEALALSGGAVYAGGRFDTIGGLQRKNIAKLSATSGNAFTGFDPISNGTVNTLAVSGSEVYAGGVFTNIGGLPRNNIAKLSATSGNAFSAWNPNATDAVFSSVNAVAVSDGVVYAGGNFDTIGGLPRENIAKLSATTGNAFSTFNPNASNSVFALAVSEGVVYAGGNFSDIGGLARNRIAKLSATSGNAFSTWNPNANSGVGAIAVSDGVVYAGGTFSQIGGLARNSIAKLSATSGGVFSAFDPRPDKPGSSVAVSTIAVSGPTVFAGGNFANVNRVPRTNLAALDSTGAPTAFNPNANARVLALAADDAGNVYAGGDFTTIGGENRNRIAKLSATSGNAFSGFNPNANETVIDLALSGTSLYAGGEFNTGPDDGSPDVSIGGQPRNRIAKLSTTSGNAFSGFNPNSNGAVFALAVQDSVVYAGGFFDNIGGLDRSALAKLSATSGNAFSGFDPGAANGPVAALAVDATSVYAGGDFTTIGGQSRNNIAKLSATSGNAFSTWNPNATDTVSALALSGGALYVGGVFNGATSIGGQSRNRLAKLSTTSGNAFELFNPDADAPVRALAAEATVVYVGGEFTTIGGRPRTGYAQFAVP